MTRIAAPTSLLLADMQEFVCAVALMQRETILPNIQVDH
jgi:hypothetical protein